MRSHSRHNKVNRNKHVMSLACQIRNSNPLANSVLHMRNTYMTLEQPNRVMSKQSPRDTNKSEHIIKPRCKCILGGQGPKERDELYPWSSSSHIITEHCTLTTEQPNAKWMSHIMLIYSWNKVHHHIRDNLPAPAALAAAHWLILRERNSGLWKKPSQNIRH